MANTFALKRSSVAGKVPSSSDLTAGELAINLADGKLFSKNGLGSVISVGGGVSAAQVYNSSTVNGAVSATAISFGSVSFDTDSIWSVGSATRLTAKTGGLYNLSFSAQVAFTAATYVLTFYVYKNGAPARTVTFRENWRWLSGDTLTVQINEMFPVSSNDYFEIYHVGDSNGYSIDTGVSTRAQLTLSRVA